MWEDGAVAVAAWLLASRLRLRGLCPLAAGVFPGGMGKKRGGAVPLEGVALSLWGIRPISEKEQSLPGKRACGPFPIHASFLF